MIFLKIRALILLSSVVVVALILWGGQILINQLSSKQQKIQQEILQREDALLKIIQVKILETGYRQGRSSIQEIYIPDIIPLFDGLSGLGWKSPYHLNSGWNRSTFPWSSKMGKLSLGSSIDFMLRISGNAL